MKAGGAFFIFVILCVGSAVASVGDLSSGARAPGMAEAFVAVADDAAASHYNPAGLTQIHQRELATHHGDFLNGLSDVSSVKASYIGYVQPLRGRAGVLGVGFQNFKGADTFSDRSFALSYGYRAGEWSVGGSVKQWARKYEMNSYTNNALNNNGVATGQPDPLFAKNGPSKNLWAVDAGTLYQLGERRQVSLGFSVANLNHPDQSLGNVNDELPLCVRGGFAYRHAVAGLMSAEVRRVSRLSSSVDTETALGFEHAFPFSKEGILSLRAGYAQGSRDFRLASTGLSIQYLKLRLDYAFSIPLGSFETKGDHRLGLTIFFGPASKAMASPVLSSARHVEELGTYSGDVQYYFRRKAEGAAPHECLMLLQEVYKRYEKSGRDLHWLYRELSNL
jgi:hypothetical protein